MGIRKYAAYDGDGIWGLGDTPEQARAEAEGYRRDSFADQNDPALLRTLAGMQVAPIDDELVQDLHMFGPGFEYFTLDDGVLVAADAPYDGPVPAPGVAELRP